MASKRALALWLLSFVLLTGCATPGEGGADKGSATIAPAVSAPATRQEASATMPRIDEAQHAALAIVLEVMRAGEWQTASEMMQELLLTYPQLAAAYANLGNIHWKLGDGAKAEQAWLKALALQPGAATVYNQLGLFYRDQGRFEEALLMYQKALSSDETYANSHRNIAILYELYLGEGEKALQHYRRYRELVGSEEHEVLLWIADLERRVKGAGE